MIGSAAISGVLAGRGGILPDAARLRPETQRPKEAQAAEAAPPRAAASGTGGIPKPLLHGETSIASQASAAGDAAATGALTPEEQEKVRNLQRRDREVRAHEQAHKAAGGSLAGHPVYQTEHGPDGRSYAVGGEVKIDTSTVPNNPDATIRKMEQVKRAALAPSNPSSADRQIAAEADAKIQQARQEKREQDAEARGKAEGDGASLGGVGVAKPGSAVSIVL